VSEAGAAPPIVGRTRRSWDDFYRITEAIERILVDEQLRWCAGWCTVCGLQPLEQCKLKRVAPEALPE